MQRREYQVAGQSRFDRNFSGLLIACFTDEDHIRILPQEGAKNAGEIEPNLFVRLDLAEAGEIVLNRIFSRRDVDLVGVDFVQRTVERGRLTGTRRPCDVDDAVRLVDHPAQLVDGRLMNNDFVQRQQRSALVQDTHHDLFTELGGYRGNAEIDAAIIDLDGNTAVLGKPAFGNIQFGKNLEA